MKFIRRLALLLPLLLFACQPATLPSVTIIDGQQVIALQTDERVPSAIFSQAGITINPNNRILFEGYSVIPNQPIDIDPIILQIRRAVTITLVTPDNQKTFQSFTFTFFYNWQTFILSSQHTNDHK